MKYLFPIFSVIFFSALVINTFMIKKEMEVKNEDLKQEIELCEETLKFYNY